MFESYTNKATTYADAMKAQEDISFNIVKSKIDISSNIVDPTNNKTSKTDTDLNKNTSSNQGDTWNDIFTKIFNKTTMFYLLIFLGIYISMYFALGGILNKGGDNSSFQLKISRIIDIIFLTFLLLFIVSYLYSSSNSTENINNSLKKYIDFLITPTSIVSSFLFLVVFYLIIYLFRIPTERDSKPIFISIIETITWLTFIVICIIDFFQYILGIPIVSMIYNFWNSLPDNQPPTLNISKNIFDNSNNNINNDNEVFNVSNNIYTYDDAQAVCKVYGAKLATYDQIEDAYNDGADWCNYGWSEGQMAFFPTQKSTWKALQSDPEKKNNCGRPGVNGGYIANPHFKFGVNCFGKKPQPSQDDLNRMNTQSITPKTPENIALDAKIQFWKDNAAKLLQINSYNKSKWSEY